MDILPNRSVDIRPLGVSSFKTVKSVETVKSVDMIIIIDVRQKMFVLCPFSV